MARSAEEDFDSKTNADITHMVGLHLEKRLCIDGVSKDPAVTLKGIEAQEPPFEPTFWQESPHLKGSSPAAGSVQAQPMDIDAGCELGNNTLQATLHNFEVVSESGSDMDESVDKLLEEADAEFRQARALLKEVQENRHKPICVADLDPDYWASGQEYDVVCGQDIRPFNSYRNDDNSSVAQRCYSASGAAGPAQAHYLDIEARCELGSDSLDATPHNLQAVSESEIKMDEAIGKLLEEARAESRQAKALLREVQEYLSVLQASILTIGPQDVSMVLVSEQDIKHVLNSMQLGCHK